MIAWITDNIGTIAVLIILVLIVSLIIIKKIRDKKNGVSSCGCGCENCPSNSSCKKNK